MNRPIRPARLVTAGAAGFLGAALSIAACSSDRQGFADPVSGFDDDASVEPEACGFRCSLDGRSVVQACTGEIVETCKPELTCGGGTCQEPCAAAAADNSSNGCDFYLQPPAYREAQACYAAYVVNTSNLPVAMSWELEGQKLDLEKAVFRATPGKPNELEHHTGPIPPGETVVVYISDADRANGAVVTENSPPCPEGVVPMTYVETVPRRTGRGTSFHLKTSAPVGLTSIYPASGGSSYVTTATLLLPVPLWGKENMIINAWSNITNAFYFTGTGPTAQIVASEDDTEVTVHPTSAVQDGVDVGGTAKGVPVTYRMRRGEVVQFRQAEELTGSVIVSNKPTTVFGGHECMFVPSDLGACAYAQQQLPALAQWGNEYAAVGHRPRVANEQEPMAYRIVAARDGTTLDYDPGIPPKGAPLTLAAGEVATFFTGVGEPFVVRTQDAEHPIYVAAYMTGAATGRYNGSGDPEFVNVIPAQQYQSAYSFYADPTYEDTSISVIRRKTNGEFKDVWLECAGVLDGWKPIGTRGEYEWRRVDLARKSGLGEAFDGGACTLGLQRMRSDGEFTATVWGWDYCTSYAYPGGMALRTVSRGSFAPVR